MVTTMRGEERREEELLRAYGNNNERREEELLRAYGNNNERRGEKRRGIVKSIW